MVYLYLNIITADPGDSLGFVFLGDAVNLAKTNHDKEYVGTKSLHTFQLPKEISGTKFAVRGTLIRPRFHFNNIALCIIFSTSVKREVPTYT